MSWILKLLLGFLIDIALKFGLPAALEWVMKRWPGIPKEALDALVALIKKALEAVSGVPDSAMARSVRMEARKEARRCVGIGCPIDTK